MKYYVLLLMGLAVASMAWFTSSAANLVRAVSTGAQAVTATPRSGPLLRPVISVANASQVVEVARLKLDGVYRIAWSPDGRTLAATSSKGVWLYSVDNLAAHPRQFGDVNQEAAQIAYSPDGRYLAFSTGDTVQIWGVETEKRLLELDGDCGLITRIVFSPDGSILAFSGGDWLNGFAGTVQLWDARTGKRQAAIAEYDLMVVDIDFHPSGKFLASGSMDRNVLLWNTTTSTARTLAIVHTDLVPVKFSPGGTLLAFGDVSETFSLTFPLRGRIRLWDTVKDVELSDLQASGGELKDLAFSPDGTPLAAGGYDDAVRLWDVKAIRQRMALTGHLGGVYSLAFSPGGRLLASAGADGTIRLWGVVQRN